MGMCVPGNTRYVQGSAQTLNAKSHHDTKTVVHGTVDRSEFVVWSASECLNSSQNALEWLKPETTSSYSCPVDWLSNRIDSQRSHADRNY